MTCTHEETHYEPNIWVDDYGNEHDFGKWVTNNTVVDVDLHRWRCTQCGHIGYYSRAARDFHERGIKTDIEGLGG